MKSKRREAEQLRKAKRKASQYRPGGQSKYAKRHKGGGNTRPEGMWVVKDGAS